MSDAHVTKSPYPTWIALALVVKPIVAMPRLRKSRQIEDISVVWGVGRKCGFPHIRSEKSDISSDFLHI